jgi:predicted dehydrogenase
VKATRAGKHVLLEKPSVSNAQEAEALFRLHELSAPNAPILLEAFHSRFYPSWLRFRSLIDPDDVVSVKSDSMIPWWGTIKTDIHFNYALSGGSIMAMGTYNFAALRMFFGAEPEEYIACDTQHYTDGENHDCDWAFRARFRFPGGRIGEASSTLRGEAR